MRKAYVKLPKYCFLVFYDYFDLSPFIHERSLIYLQRIQKPYIITQIYKNKKCGWFYAQ